MCVAAWTLIIREGEGPAATLRGQGRPRVLLGWSTESSGALLPRCNCRWIQSRPGKYMVTRESVPSRARVSITVPLTGTLPRPAEMPVKGEENLERVVEEGKRSTGNGLKINCSSGDWRLSSSPFSSKFSQQTRLTWLPKKLFLKRTNLVWGASRSEWHKGVRCSGCRGSSRHSWWEY